MNGLNSEQGAATKLSNPSEYMEGHQESAEPDTPTSVASSTRYRDLPTWSAKINEHECHPIKSLQSFEQGLGDSELEKHERDVNELAEWIKSQLQHILYEELDQNLKGCKTARHWKTQRSRHRPRRSARIRQRELKTGIYYGVRGAKKSGRTDDGNHQSQNPEDKSTDVASVVRSQTLEQDTQGITTDKQGFLGERPEPMGKEEIEGLTDEKITPKRLRRRIQTALMFLRVGKSLRAGSRQIWDKYHNNRL
ncbi:hypothetical protein PG990_001620 [Apiospora arundinis]